MEFRIVQYETHTQEYSVEAEDEADAIKRLFDGEGAAIDGTLEFVGVDELRGVDADEAGSGVDLAKKLKEAGIRLDDDCFIPTVYSIEPVGTD